jgi:hypothetical protein
MSSPGENSFERIDFKEPHRRSGKRIFYLLGALLFTVGISLRLASAGRTGFFWSAAGDLGSFTAIGVVVSLVYERFVRSQERELLLSDIGEMLSQKLKEAREGIVVFEHGRPSLDEKMKIIESAKIEVIEVGISIRTFVGYFNSRPAIEFRDPFVRLMRARVKVRCLLMDPDWSFSREVEGAELPNRIRASLGALHDLNENFSKLGIERPIELYLYRSMPHFAAICIDGDSEGGKMLFSPYLHRMNKAEAPCFFITRKSNPIMFTKFWDSINNLIADAGPQIAPASRQASSAT